MHGGLSQNHTEKSNQSKEQDDEKKNLNEG
jgi:hypothetical protein